MGTFRFVLAFAVLISHIATVIGPSVVNRESLHILVWSGNAVFAFFVISGFYMSLIINTKYRHLRDGTRRFYVNRALRLYPTQWILLAGYAAAYLASGAPSFLLGDFRHPIWRWVYGAFSNTFILGSEILPFLAKANWSFVIGPIWSLSLELYFYLLAPFIVTRRLRTILVLGAIALAFRLSMYVSGVPLLPWRYFFFPADIVFFLIGAAAYHLYARFKDSRAARPLGIIAGLALIAYLVTPRLWTAPDLDQPLAWCFYTVVALATPFLFALTRGWKVDNLLGQLSYPVYLSHMLAIEVVVRRPSPFGLDKGVTATIVTLLVSVALYTLVDRPIERIRSRIATARYASAPAMPVRRQEGRDALA